MINAIVLSKEDFIEKDGNYFMSMRELAKRFGYKNDRKLYMLYRRHEDELSEYVGMPTVGTASGKQCVKGLTELGCYTIAMFAQTDKAKAFRKALAHFIQDVRKGDVVIIRRLELAESNIKQLEVNLNHVSMNYATNRKNALLRKRRANMNKTQYNNVVRLQKKGYDVALICELLDVRPFDVHTIKECESVLQKGWL